MEDTARAIIKEHGKECDTFKLATDFLAEIAPLAEMKLLSRLPALMAEFKAAVESLGLTY